jgi:hypothetical protein
MAFTQGVAKNEELQRRLSSQGLRSFKPMAGGNNSLVLQFPGDVYLSGDHLYPALQVIRFNLGTEDPRALALEQIQPIPGHDHISILPEKPNNKMIYDILPMVPKRMHKEQWHSFLLHMKEKYGMDVPIITDAVLDSENARSFPDGPPVGVDQDFTRLPDESAEVPYNTIKYDPKRDAAYVVTGKVDVNGNPIQSRLFGEDKKNGFLPAGTISVQEEYFPALMDGRIRGVLSDEDRVRLETGGIEAFNQLRKEKPECFMFPLIGDLSPEEKIAFQTGGLSALCDLRPQGFMQVTPENLSKFMQMVFEDNMYPAQAMLELYFEVAIANNSLAHGGSANRYDEGLGKSVT